MSSSGPNTGAIGVAIGTASDEVGMVNQTVSKTAVPKTAVAGVASEATSGSSGLVKKPKMAPMVSVPTSFIQSSQRNLSTIISGLTSINEQLARISPVPTGRAAVKVASVGGRRRSRRASRKGRKGTRRH